MKKLICSSLVAVSMFASCQNESNKEKATADSTAIASPSVVNTDSVTPPTAGEKVYSFVHMDYPPTYPDGIDAFYKFLNSEIKYPAAAIEKKTQGIVLVSFIVEKDGSLSDIKADNELGSGTEQEAVRVIKLSKKWNPGMDKGIEVRTVYKVPVKFILAAK